VQKSRTFRRQRLSIDRGRRDTLVRRVVGQTAREVSVSLAYTIIIGFFVGVIARFTYPGPQPMSWIWTILLGVGGAIVAGWGGQALGLYEPGEPASFVSSIIGALVLLFIYNRMTGKK